MTTEAPISLEATLQAAKETTTPDDAFTSAIQFQLELSQRISQLLAPEKRIINQIPQEVLGTHHLLDTKPLSTTSEVVFTDSGLALKIFSFRDHEQQAFTPNNHGLYAMTDARVRLMSAAGEVGIGQLMNQDAQGEPLYYGLAMVAVGPDNTVSLSKIDDAALQHIVRGEREVCIVMRRMSGSLLDQILEIKAGNNPSVTETQLADQAEVMLERLLKAATPLTAEHAAELGSPHRTEKTLTQDTPAWLAFGRSEADLATGNVAAASANAREAIEEIKRFFAIPETPDKLAERAVPSRTKDGVTTMIQSYSSGDTKFGNILYDENGEAFFSDGLSLIVKTGMVPGNAEPVFAPWAFNDIMQSVAYFDLEARAYDLPEVNRRVKAGLRAYVSQTEAWTPWHDAYFEVLVAYKLLVEAACAVDNYLSQCDHETKQVLPTMDPHTKKKVEEYPVLAQQIVRQAMAMYAQQTAVAA
jgi:hypothetical protein